MGISNLLIPKGLRSSQKPIEGSTKSPKAILDDAHASPAGRGPKARVNPSLSAIRYSYEAGKSPPGQPCIGETAFEWRSLIGVVIFAPLARP
jgi:hypothetical protein